MTTSNQTWVAAKRVEARRYERHPDSPEFTSIDLLMDWLEERGLIVRIGQPHECLGFEGWGDPWFAVSPEKAH